MVSRQAKMLSAMLRLVNLKGSVDAALDSGGARAAKTAPPPRSLQAHLNVEERRVQGRSVYFLRRKDKIGNRHIFYLHGGAYVHSISRLHWALIERISKATGCSVVVPAYPLTPIHTFVDAFRMVEPLYRDVLAQVGTDEMILMGDSAGGGFALALAQKLKADGVDAAGHIILLSPWLDAALDDEAIAGLEKRDPILAVSALRRAAISYSGGTPLDNPLLSPIKGNLHGLGKVSLFIGTNDILLADARRFKALTEAQGVSINYFEYEEMLHDWLLFNLPESTMAIRQIAGLIDSEIS